MTQYSDYFQTRITAAMNASQTTVALESDTNIPDLPFYVSIGSEIIEVTSLSSGLTYNCTRAADGTTATAHSVDSDVKHVLMRADIERGIARVGTLANRVAEAGAIYYPNDFEMPVHYDGSAWGGYIRGLKLTAPPTTGWSSINMPGGETITHHAIYTELEIPDDVSAFKVFGRVRAMAAAPSYAIFGMTGSWSVWNSNTFGAYVTNGTHLNGIEVGHTNNIDGAMYSMAFVGSDAHTAFTNGVLDIGNLGYVQFPIFFGIENTTTETKTYFSQDLKTWEHVRSEAHSSRYASVDDPDEVGIFMRPNSGTPITGQLGREIQYLCRLVHFETGSGSLP